PHSIMLAPTVSNLNIGATLDGQPWAISGTTAINYFISGSGGSLFNGTPTVPLTLPNVAPDTYSLVYTGGGPANSTLATITCVTSTAATPTAKILQPLAAQAPPTCSAAVAAGQTLTFTLEFTSNTPTPPPATFSETFDHAPDYANKWHVVTRYGTTQINYTSGQLQMVAARSD